MKKEVKLTSVNLVKDVYNTFRTNTAETDMNFQKLVNRSLDLYNKDENFRDKINSHETLGVKNSKY
jgi:hypothetical protein